MYNLKNLPYAYDALQPVISSDIVHYHYDKHLNTYVTNYNNLVKDTKWDNEDIIDVLKRLSEIDESIRGGIRNNGGGVINHVLYFNQFKPNSQNTQINDCELLNQINEDFGSFDQFIEELKNKAITLFGSGWAWLVLNDGHLEIKQYPNQDNPYMEHLTPLLGIDVWEHSYYLDYKNVRPDYVNNLITIIDWDVINERFISSK